MNTPDYTEFEAKFYPVNKEEYRKKLKEVGARLVTPERKLRRAIVDKSNYPQLAYHYLRVRDEGDCTRLSVKTHASASGEMSDQKEIDVTVSDYDKTIKIIESLGFQFTSYQENLRESWELEGAEITIDTWPGLETYSEVEASSEAEVKRIALKLGLNWENRRITSVKDIYMEIYKLSRPEATKRLKHITFEHNEFKIL